MPKLKVSTSNVFIPSEPLFPVHFIFHHATATYGILVPGFAKDIGVTSNDVNDAVSLFFITFVIFQPISAAAGRMIGPKYWMPFLMVGSDLLSLYHCD